MTYWKYPTLDWRVFIATTMIIHIRHKYVNYLDFTHIVVVVVFSAFRAFCVVISHFERIIIFGVCVFMHPSCTHMCVCVIGSQSMVSGTRTIIWIIELWHWRWYVGHRMRFCWNVAQSTAVQCTYQYHHCYECPVIWLNSKNAEVGQSIFQQRRLFRYICDLATH